MANQKISELTEITSVDSDNDFLPIYDATDAGTKKVKPKYVWPSFADGETPSGLVNGVNTTYVLAHTPNPVGSLKLFINGSLMAAGGVDYTLATATITTVTAPPTGSVIIAFYRY